MKYSPRDIYNTQKQVRKLIETIPKQNKQKFSVDLLKLIQLAHEVDYENFNLER